MGNFIIFLLLVVMDEMKNVINEFGMGYVILFLFLLLGINDEFNF